MSDSILELRYYGRDVQLQRYGCGHWRTIEYNRGVAVSPTSQLFMSKAIIAIIIIGIIYELNKTIGIGLFLLALLAMGITAKQKGIV